jgi:hypothetical protein
MVSFNEEGGKYFSSSNPSVWTSHTDISASYRIKSNIYAAGIYVAVGGDVSNNKQIVLYSTTGSSNWTLATGTGLGDGTLYSITYANGLFVAVGNTGGGGNQVLLYSRTGKDGWMPSQNSGIAPGNLKSILYADGKYIAVGVDGMIGARLITYSTTGISDWTTVQLQASGVNGPGMLNYVTYANGVFVAVGTDGTNQLILFSISGTSGWVAINGLTGGNLLGLAYGNGKFVAVGDDGAGSQVVLHSSTGYYGWANANGSGISKGTLSSINFLNRHFFASGSSTNGNAKIIYSMSGATDWDISVSYEVEPTGQLTAIGYVNNVFLAFGSSSNTVQLYYSDNPTSSWSKNTLLSPDFALIKSVTYGNGYYVAVGQTNSSNQYIAWNFGNAKSGNWITIPTLASGSLNAIAYGNGYFVAVGNDSTGKMLIRYADTPSGTWNSISGMPDGFFSDVKFLNGRFFAVGLENIGGGIPAIYSSDIGSSNWSASTGSFNNGQLNSITWSNGVYVAVGNSGDVYYSNSGTSGWAPGTSSASTSNFNSVSSDDNGNFIAVGNGVNPEQIYSTDGMTFRRKSLGFGAVVDLKSMTYGNGLYVAVGTDSGPIPVVAFTTDITQSLILPTIQSGSTAAITNNTNVVNYSNSIVYSNDGLNFSTSDNLLHDGTNLIVNGNLTISKDTIVQQSLMFSGSNSGSAQIIDVYGNRGNNGQILGKVSGNPAWMNQPQQIIQSVLPIVFPNSVMGSANIYTQIAQENCYYPITTSDGLASKYEILFDLSSLPNSRVFYIKNLNSNSVNVDVMWTYNASTPQAAIFVGQFTYLAPPSASNPNGSYCACYWDNYLLTIY